MNKLVNRYNLNMNVTKEDLINAGFKDGGWMNNIPSPKVRYNCSLHEDIELHIEICVKDEKISFDDFDNILIFDDEMGQPYHAFYSHHLFPYLKIVIDKYNQKMDEFVKQGIFEPKPEFKINEPNKVKIKRKN